MKCIPQFPDNDLYQIRIRGNLDERWVGWFDDFALTWVDQNETMLTGKVKDQAALHGILGRIRDLGLDLLLVKKVGYVCSRENSVDGCDSQYSQVNKQDKKG